MKADARDMQDYHDLLTFLNIFVIKNESMSQQAVISYLACVIIFFIIYTMKL